VTRPPPRKGSDHGSLEQLTATIKSDIASIAALRDHLLVQLDLAKLEAHDEWHELENKWHQVEDELRSMGDHAKEPSRRSGRRHAR